jgi:hypothetical protein
MWLLFTISVVAVSILFPEAGFRLMYRYSSSSYIEVYYQKQKFIILRYAGTASKVMS